MQESKQGFYAFILFLIWPFLATVAAFKNYRKPWAKNILWLFCIFYGFTFAIGAESQESDIVRYAAELKQLHGQEMSVAQAIQYFQDSGEIDIVRTVIAVGLSRLTGSQPVLTMVYAIIFGFFYSRNMWYIMERLEGKLMPITILLLMSFFLLNPIWEINGFRMWTAVHIFLFGLLPYLCEGKTKYLFISVLSIAMHFSMLVPVGILFGYIVAGNRMNVYFGAFIFTSFFTELDITAFNNLMEAYAPEIFQDRTAGYRQEDVEEEPRDRVWYAVWHGRGLRYAVLALLIGLFITGREHFKKHRMWMNLFCFTLFFYSAANLLSALASGGRFVTIANLCAIALLTLYIQNISREKVMKRFGIAVIPALALYIIVSFRIGLYSMSATSILGNPIVAVLMYENFMSLNDFLKMLL